MTDDGLEAWRSFDPLTAALDDEGLELVADVVRRFVLRQPVGLDEKAAVIAILSHGYAVHGLDQLAEWLQQGGDDASC